MRKLLLIGGAIAGFVVLCIGALGLYALLNLNSLIAANRGRFLALLSHALGRRVEVEAVQARIGLGLSVKLVGFKVADDPAFSQLPFLQANEAALKVDFLPLLRGRARLAALDLDHPAIRILRNSAGELNLESVGANAGPQAESPNSGRPEGALASALIKSLHIEGGTVYYSDASQQGAPVQLENLDLDANDLSITSPFSVEMRCALLGREQNLQVEGEAGPLWHNRGFQLGDLPFDLKVKVGPIVPDQVRTLAEVGHLIPPELSMPDPVSASGTLKGSLDAVVFDLDADLASARLAYTGLFSKPAGTKMTVGLEGRLQAAKLKVSRAELALAALNLKATDLVVGGKTALIHARVDSNNFDLAQIAPMVTPLAGYNLSGKAEVHGILALTGGRIGGDATMTLSAVALRMPGAALPGISNLDSKLAIQQGVITLGPAAFAIGSSHATLEARATSLDPLDATFKLATASLKPGEFLAKRPAGEVVNGLAVSGTVQGTVAAPIVNAKIRSSNGRLQQFSYQALDLTAAYNGSRISAQPLQVGVFGGSVNATGNLIPGSTPRFQVAMTMDRIDVQQAMAAFDLGAAKRLRGGLSGEVNVVGSGADWKRVRPTLSGNGRVALAGGKLAGINIVALAINQVAAAPGVSQIVNATFLSSHRGLLADPDTELSDARMTFTLAGSQITTHDLIVRSPDYGITGDGWFDMDSNIDMSSDIQLTFGLSVAIPVVVKGQLPVVIVLPNIPKLAERIAMGAITTPGKVIQGGASAVSGLLGGTSGGSRSGSSVPNPLNLFKKILP